MWSHDLFDMERETSAEAHFVDIDSSVEETVERPPPRLLVKSVYTTPNFAQMDEVFGRRQCRQIFFQLFGVELVGSGNSDSHKK